MGLKEFTNSPTGKVTVAIVFILSMIALFFSIRSNFSSAADDAANRIFIDAQTGQAFKHKIQLGESIPVDAPSGQKAGYEAELCYWTKDGKPKDTPTPVLLNIYKGVKGPTFCPDCGRLVVGHNPPALEGATPPPTQAEFASRRATRE
jgi:hypothetical protein